MKGPINKGENHMHLYLLDEIKEEAYYLGYFEGEFNWQFLSTYLQDKSSVYYYTRMLPQDKIWRVSGRNYTVYNQTKE